MNTQIYILESCGSMNRYQRTDGSVFSYQDIKLRELNGEQFSQRWIVDNLSGEDLTPFIGHPIACYIENYVTENGGREFNNLRIREVVKLSTDTGAF